jgi:hypothetical protein
MRRGIRGLLHVALLLGIAAANAQVPAATAPPAATASASGKARQLVVKNQRFTGDFNAMLERRMIRVYAPYSRSLYFIDKGRERGLGAELVRDFSAGSAKYAKQLGKRPIWSTRRRDVTKLLTDLSPKAQADIAVATSP